MSSNLLHLSRQSLPLFLDALLKIEVCSKTCRTKTVWWGSNFESSNHLAAVNLAHLTNLTNQNSKQQPYRTIHCKVLYTSPHPEISKPCIFYLSTNHGATSIWRSFFKQECCISWISDITFSCYFQHGFSWYWQKEVFQRIRKFVSIL